MTPHVREVQVPIITDSHSMGLSELGVPCPQEVAVAVQDHHLVIASREEIDVVLAVSRDARYLKELISLRQRPPALHELISVFPDLISH